MKPYTLERAYDINKCHDFWKMVNHYKSYDLQVKLCCKSSPDTDLSSPSNTRRRFTSQKKAAMPLHYSTTENFRETARAVVLSATEDAKMHLCSSLFFINLQPWRLATLLKRDFNTGVPCKICEIFKNTYLEHMRTTASEYLRGLRYAGDRWC